MKDKIKKLRAELLSPRLLGNSQEIMKMKENLRRLKPKTYINEKRFDFFMKILKLTNIIFFGNSVDR